jgi:hypothetical protein
MKGNKQRMEGRKEINRNKGHDRKKTKNDRNRYHPV